MRGHTIRSLAAKLPTSSRTRQLIFADVSPAEVYQSAIGELSRLGHSVVGGNLLSNEVPGLLSAIAGVAVSPERFTSHEFTIGVSKAAEADRLWDRFEESLRARDLPEPYASSKRDHYDFDCSEEQAEEIRKVAEEVWGPMFLGCEEIKAGLR